MVVFLYHKYHPADGRTTGRNMLLKIEVKESHKIAARLLVVFTYYEDDKCFSCVFILYT
jgi:hypothetical protein